MLEDARLVGEFRQAARAFPTGAGAALLQEVCGRHTLRQALTSLWTSRLFGVVHLQQDTMRVRHNQRAFSGGRPTTDRQRERERERERDRREERKKKLIGNTGILMELQEAILFDPNLWSASASCVDSLA